MTRHLFTTFLAATVAVGLTAAGSTSSTAGTGTGTGTGAGDLAPAAAALPAAATAEATTASVQAVLGPAQRAVAMRRAQTQAARVAEGLGLSARERLVVKDVIADPDGTRHVRYTRTYAGHSVVGGDLVVHTSAAGRRTVDWASTADLSALGAPRATLAAPAAANTVAARSILVPVGAAPSLVVYALGGRARLAWQVVVAGRSAGGGTAREVSFVDADSGAPLNSWSLLEHANGQGRSLYSGRVRLNTVRAAGRFVLRDVARGGHQVRDMHNVNNPRRTGTLFTDADNVWGNGRANQRQSAAVDAAYGAAKTWDYFKSQHRRTGIRNNGRASTSRVHFGSRLDNAFWQDSCFCMTYGDGGALLKPVVSLDVAGHEMTHGITSATADLIYVGESGGLNEATSDIFGTLVEFYARNPADRGDYLIGEEVIRGGGSLRRMDRPAADGRSFNCWSPTVGANDVHLSSGVANHFFYLLAEGSGAKVINGTRHNSPTCNASAVTGISRARAARIWYRALTVYMTSSSNYTDARDATIRAARDLFGAGSTACSRVTRAWAAVRVPAGIHACTGVPVPAGRNALANPGFEAGRVGWTGAAAVVLRATDQFRFPHTGRWYARFNDQGVANTDTLAQRVNVPAGTPKLRLQLLVATNERGSRPFDTLAVQVDDATRTTTLKTYSNADGSFTYLRKTLDLSAFAGQRVTLRFVGIEDASVPTMFLIDDVSVTRS